jgi:hypothetical protein
MKFIKTNLNKIKSNPLLRNALIGIGVFFLIVIILILFASCTKNKKYTYEELESKMVSLAKAKAKKQGSNLPQNDKDEIEISLETLLAEGNLKDTASITKKKSTCTGNVKIINNNGYYLYIPYLDCGTDYQSQTIYNELTNENNITTSGNGLYNTGSTYTYKGDNVNNYLSLNGIKYRIIGINEDSTIRVIDISKRDTAKWDDRYNLDKKSNVGINDYLNNNINSRIKDTIETLYMNNEIFTDEMRAYFVNTPLCTGKRSVNDNIFDTSIECSQNSETYPFGLITAAEFFAASLDSNCLDYESSSCLNYNYFIDIGSTWTITADKDTSYKVYKMTSSGISLSNASNSSNVKIVTTLNKDLLIQSGDGTETSPYIIKTF